MPIASRGPPVFLAGFPGSHPMRHLFLPVQAPVRYVISGITKDSAGVALGNCVVEVFETISRRLHASTISDVTGAYLVDVTGEADVTFFVVAYQAGSPDVAGTTVNTLVGVNA